jgi:microcin C transport system permease protein
LSTTPAAVGGTLTLSPAAPARSRDGPWRRAWRRFRANRLGYASLMIFLVIFGVSLLAEVWSNDKPLVVRYQGHWYFPIVQTLPETTFGGDFPTQTDYFDPFILKNLRAPGNVVIFPLNYYHYNTINYFSRTPNPAAPSAGNLLGTSRGCCTAFACR